jgi:hypothetical protein
MDNGASPSRDTTPKLGALGPSRTPSSADVTGTLIPSGRHGEPSAGKTQILTSTRRRLMGLGMLAGLVLGVAVDSSAGDRLPTFNPGKKDQSGGPLFGVRYHAETPRAGGD